MTGTVQDLGKAAPPVLQPHRSENLCRTSITLLPRASREMCSARRPQPQEVAVTGTMAHANLHQHGRMLLEAEQSSDTLARQGAADWS